MLALQTEIKLAVTSFEIDSHSHLASARWLTKSSNTANGQPFQRL